MVYIIFIGLVVAAAAASPSGPVGNAILLSAGLVAAITSAATVGLSAALGGSSSPSEAVKVNLSALIVVGLIFAFGLQVGKASAAVLLAAPVLAFVAATLVFSKGLGLTFPRALVLSVAGAVSVYLALKLFGGSIMRVVLPA